MRKIKKLIAIFMTFYLISLMMSFLGFQSAYANAIETPSNYMDVEVKFIVYPDGTVGLAGKYNYTSAYPFYLFDPYTRADIELDAQITKNGDMHDVSIATTLTVPSEEASEFPFNATTATMTGEYSNGIYTTDISVSVTFPDSFYTDSTLMDFSIFPFNSTDFTITGEYSEQSFNGKITVHMLPGLTLGDIDVNFEGNLTNLTIDDELTVFYNYTSSILGFPPLNETSLNELLLMLNRTIPGVEPKSLYNMTDGMLTCTTFNTALTPIDANSATVSFLIIIQGDFIELLTKLFSGSLFTGVPPPYPEGAIYSLINATLHSIENTEFTLSYSKAAKQLDFQAAVTTNVEEYRNITSQILPEMYPPKMQPYIESMLNTTYCSLYSSTETLSYQNGQMNYEGNYTIEGDLNAEVNYLKNLYFDMMNATYPAPPQMNILKDIYPDISNLHLNFKIEKSSILFNFDGAKVTPPIDSINTTSFRLERFFNIASSEYEPPRENEKTKLIVQGGSNGTHTVELFIDPTDPERVPNPDKFAEKNTMIWNNQGISKLKRLIFKVREGYVETIYNPESVTQDNPFMIHAEETARCVLTLTDVSKFATICIKNITAPADFSLPPETYKVLGSYIQITAEPEDVTVNATIRIYYTPEQLSELGLDENSLKIFYWNEAANNWEAIDTQINTTEHYVWATVSHLSIWALMGQSLPVLWEQPWFLISITAIIIIVIIATLLGLRRKKQSP
ncbi:MAG: hypothetical protein OEY95_00610 [Candidatus Bathyarchaeota archaeon]|nr:hypothetical protein [Candidatus Bathyarchaeota archaeon]